MKSFKRNNEPDFLVQNAAKWNQQWADLKLRNPGASFQWYKHKGSTVNQLLIGDLAAQTQEHCSYCDAFPPRSNDNTIDHFRPKSHPAYYLDAYLWGNLYFACGHCQQLKLEQFSEDLLRPDALDYNFDRYFVYNYKEHEIEFNPAASEEEQRKAKTTIAIFGFNESGQPTSRRHAWERWTGKSEEDRVVDDFPFRFLFLGGY